MTFKASIATACTAMACACLGSSPAQAQSLGDVFGRVAGRAIDRVTDEAARGAAQPRPSRRGRSPQAGHSAEAEASGAPAPAGVEPWPVNAGSRAVARPGQFAFSPEMNAQKQRFIEASRFACSTCEGSADIDGWRKAFAHPDATYSSWSTILAGWTVGRTIDWRGTAHDGRITVLGETPVGGFRCRQLRHRIAARGPRPVVAERPGLICLGKQDAYSADETWHEVF